MQVLRFDAPDDGWTAGPGDAAPLTSMALFSGPPAELAMLQPTSANGQRARWTLEPPYKGGLWLQCAYGSNSLTLSRPLASIPKACVATYGKEHPYQPRAIEFVCH